MSDKKIENDSWGDLADPPAPKTGLVTKPASVPAASAHDPAVSYESGRPSKATPAIGKPAAPPPPGPRARKATLRMGSDGTSGPVVSKPGRADQTLAMFRVKEEPISGVVPIVEKPPVVSKTFPAPRRDPAPPLGDVVEKYRPPAIRSRTATLMGLVDDEVARLSPTPSEPVAFPEPIPPAPEPPAIVPAYAFPSVQVTRRMRLILWLQEWRTARWFARLLLKLLS